MKNKKRHAVSLMMTPKTPPAWPVKPPLYLSSTFAFLKAEAGEGAFDLTYGKIKKTKKNGSGMIYARLNGPNLQLAENQLTLCENGAESCAFFSSGLASITTVISTFLKKDGIILASSPLYGGTHHFIEQKIASENVCFFTPSMSQYDIETLLNSKTSKKLSMILVETPANPTNAIFDIKMLSKIAKKYSSPEQKAYLVVDNTYLGPLFQSPLTLGADLVVYSATKYIGGHSDLLAGACLGSKKLINQVKESRTFLGNMADQFTCWLVTRSLETLHLRMKNQAKNAKKIAKYLSEHSMVEKIYYLGNPDSKKTEKIIERQCSSFGAMIAFDIVGAKKEAFNFLNSLKIIKIAVSLGGNESLAEHPYTMTHAGMDDNLKKDLGITNKMIRLSIGNEHYTDLIADISQALQKAKK